MEETPEKLSVWITAPVSAGLTPSSIRMRSQDHLEAASLFEGSFQVLVFEGALRGRHCRFNTGSKMQGLDLTAKGFGIVHEEPDTWNGQSGAVSTVRHCHKVNFLVPPEFPISFFDPFVTLHASNAGVVFDTFAINDGDLGHDTSGSRFRFSNPRMKTTITSRSPQIGDARRQRENETTEIEVTALPGERKEPSRQALQPMGLLRRSRVSAET